MCNCLGDTHHTPTDRGEELAGLPGVVYVLHRKLRFSFRLLTGRYCVLSNGTLLLAQKLSQQWQHIAGNTGSCRCYHSTA